MDLHDDEAFFKVDKKGREVIQWRVSSQFPVKVGDTVTLAGRTVKVEAIGNEFAVLDGKKHRKFQYLYLEVPVVAPVARPEKTGYVDEDVAQFELSAENATRNDETDNRE